MRSYWVRFFVIGYDWRPLQRRRNSNDHNFWQFCPGHCITLWEGGNLPILLFYCIWHFMTLKKNLSHFQQIWTDATFSRGDKIMRFANGEIQRKNADNKAVKGSFSKRCSIVIIKDHEYEYDAKECSKGFKGICKFNPPTPDTTTTPPPPSEICQISVKIQHLCFQ